MPTRVEEARQVAQSLLEDLEASTSEVGAVLMRALRLARLMRDGDQIWLEHEMRGYPTDFDIETFGTCAKYAVMGKRIDMKTGKYYVSSLPALEANAKANNAILEAISRYNPSIGSAENYLGASATMSQVQDVLNKQHEQKNVYADSVALVSALKTGIHSYVTDVYLSIEFGDVAESIFEQARKKVDAFVSVNCPKAAERLLAINDRMSEATAESRAAALTSCRRLLLAVADALFPARPSTWIDRKGKERQVGEEQYKNRLLAFLSEFLESEGTTQIFEAQLERLAGVFGRNLREDVQGRSR